MDSLPRVRLYCFPYAGAAASVYMRWKRHLPDFLEVVPVELPGHGRRSSEALRSSMAAVVTDLRQTLNHDPTSPFVLFGHSLGALVAFEYAYRLEQEQQARPLLLIASGAHAPSHRRVRQRHTFTDAALRAELVKLDGTPASVLADPELMELVLGVLRADFSVADTYFRPTNCAVQCPIHAIAGSEDAVNEQALSSWREHTLFDFGMSFLPGGHFYLHPSEEALLALLVRRITQELTRPPASLGPRRTRPLDTQAERLTGRGSATEH